MNMWKWDKKTDELTPVNLSECKMGPDERRVAFDEIDTGSVSTVFLAVEHYGGMLFETMIFGHESDEEYQWRYKTAKEAREGHAKVLEWVRSGMHGQCTLDAS